jgi:hypothetical protein
LPLRPGLDSQVFTASRSSGEEPIYHKGAIRIDLTAIDE